MSSGIAVSFSGGVLHCGGYDNVRLSGQPTDKCYFFDPTADAGSAPAPEHSTMTAKRANAAAVAFDGGAKVWVLGGEDENGEGRQGFFTLIIPYYT